MAAEITKNHQLHTGATYQWLDCDNNYAIIPGETGQSYTAIAIGNYAVELSENGCVDTTGCVSITTIGIIENNFGNDFKLYPNPTDGNFSVDLSNDFGSVIISITDIYGKLIQSSEYRNSQILNLNLSEPPGIYLLTIKSTTNKAVIRLVKE